MDSSFSSLCITSYNSTGFSISTEQFVSQLLLYSQIVCLQEHFLQSSGDKKYSNTDKIRKAFKNKDMFINPAVKENSQISRGRAKGGLVTIWDKVSQNMFPKLNVKTSDFKEPNFLFQKAVYL